MRKFVPPIDEYILTDDRYAIVWASSVLQAGDGDERETDRSRKPLYPAAKSTSPYNILACRAWTCLSGDSA